MTLSERDRRILAALEESLAASDPELIATFSRLLWTVRIHRARTASGWLTALVVLLLLGGVVCHDSSMLTGGCLVLAFLPACVWLIAQLPRGVR